jgi:hypothetical protein
MIMPMCMEICRTNTKIMNYAGYNGFWGERIIAAKQQGFIAWGFNPRKENKQSFAPKGRGMMANENIPRPFRAHLLILDNLGLKPQATQLNPFGGYIGLGGRCRP